MNISETSQPIKIKFHLEHHWGGGLAALDFQPNQFRTLVSMATDSSHRAVMGTICDHSSSFIFDLFLQVISTKTFGWVQNSARSDQGLRS